MVFFFYFCLFINNFEDGYTALRNNGVYLNHKIIKKIDKKIHLIVYKRNGLSEIVSKPINTQNISSQNVVSSKNVVPSKNVSPSKNSPNNDFPKNSLQNSSPSKNVVPSKNSPNKDLPKNSERKIIPNNDNTKNLPKKIKIEKDIPKNKNENKTITTIVPSENRPIDLVDDNSSENDNSVPISTPKSIYEIVDLPIEKVLFKGLFSPLSIEQKQDVMDFVNDTSFGEEEEIPIIIDQRNCGITRHMFRERLIKRSGWLNDDVKINFYQNIKIFFI